MAWVTTAMYWLKKASPAAVDRDLWSRARSSVCGLNDRGADGGIFTVEAANVWLNTMA